jgi:putative ABC transport system substrate-binding protein
MRRRDFIAGLGGAAVVGPRGAWGQQGGGVRRIAVMFSTKEASPYVRSNLPWLLKGLENLGWRDGQTISIAYKWNETPATLAERAREVVALAPEVIFAGAASTLLPIQAATRSIPIVFANVPDPVGNGFVASLARPGGNITGFANYEETVGGKWIELLVQLAPRTKRIAVMYDPANPATRGYLRSAEQVGRAIGVDVIATVVRNGGEAEQAVASFAREPNGGLVVPPGPTTATYSMMISAMATHHQLPAVFPYGTYVKEGALASYGVDPSQLFLKSASYVDRILKGEKPGDLPIQYATTYHLAINLKTAKALNLDIPVSLLARTDEVIE